PDPRVALTTSVRALDALKRDGLVEHVGLCNVTVGQIEEANRITDIAAVQIELSLWHDQNVHAGVLDYCFEHGIPLLAYRPLGGAQKQERLESDSLLAELAKRHHVTPAEIALAWLAGLSPIVIPLPGPTRVETARSAAQAVSVTLTPEDCQRLENAFVTPRAIRSRTALRNTEGRRTDGEIVLIMGLPGAGKSTLAATFVGRGYQRLNRDEA